MHRGTTYVLVVELHSDGVRAVGALALLPRHEAAVHASGGAAGALTSDGGQLARVLLLRVVQLRQGGDEASQAGGGRCQSRAGGKSVHGRDANVVLGPVLLLHDNLTGRGVNSVLSESADLTEASLSTAVDLSLLSVQPHAIAGEVGARSDSGDGVEITLVQGDTGGGVHRRVQRNIVLAPVLDHSNYGGNKQVMTRPSVGIDCAILLLVGAVKVSQILGSNPSVSCNTNKDRIILTISGIA